MLRDLDKILGLENGIVGLDVDGEVALVLMRAIVRGTVDGLDQFGFVRQILCISKLRCEEGLS